MISTYLGYQLYARDETRSQARVDAEPVNKIAKAYYDANIGKVKSVDDFVNNYRLFSYAMKAYGLEDMTYAKALMKRVLTSDLTSATSVANQLSDSRYLAFAKAFSFTTAGAVATPSIQTAAQQAATTAAFTANTASTLDPTTAKAATTYYTAHIGAVSSVAALERDPKLFQYVLTAYGLDASTPQATVSSIVESNLADPNSAINKTAGSGDAALQQAVNVSASGGPSTQTLPAQTTAAVLAAVSAYSAATATAAQAAGKTESAYYASTIPTITSVDGLLADSRLVAYVTRAYGLPTTSPAQLRQVLTSDVSDPTSLANTLGSSAYGALASAFNFASDGSLKTEPFQNTDQQDATVALYTARHTSDTAAMDAATQYYKANIGAVKTVDDLEANAQLKSYVFTAYGIDAATPAATVANILEQTPTATGSVVATTAGSRDLLLASAFTVSASGAGVGAAQAQTSAAVTATTTAYAASVGSDPASKTAAAAETAYYKSTIGTVNSVGALLADKRLVAYVEKAYGLPAGTSTDQLRSVLTSDPMAATSVASTLGPSYRSVAAAFSFAATGLLKQSTTAGAQTAPQQIATDTAYGRSALEDEAGTDNTGVKLALYFQRVAPTITSGYGILADKALLQVFQTVLGLPASSAKADIDAQARYLQSKVNFADLKDPVKLNQMVQRFAALYDLANPTSTDTVSALFGSSSS